MTAIFTDVTKRIQSGTWDANAGTWVDSTSTTVTATKEHWTQWDATGIDSNSLYLAVTPAATIRFVCSPGAGTGQLEFLAWVGPLFSDFSAAAPPVSRDFRRPAVRKVTASFNGTVNIALPLYETNNELSPLGAALGANLRPYDSLGRRRFAIGCRLTKTSPSAQIAFVVMDSFTAYVGDNFTGLGGVRGTAGKDRAVRCPRCGNVLKEADLIADGVTRTYVCPDCYDPPTEPPNFRWPFRT